MAVSNSLTIRKKATGLTAYLTQDAVKNQINNVIGGKDGQKFIAAVVSAVNTNPALQECSNGTILSAALLGQSLKLSPSPQLGHYYMVPFNDKTKGKVAQFQLGYKGYIQLAIRSGQYKKINVMAIKAGELEYFNPLNEEIKVNLMVDDWDAREEAETIGYYAMLELVNGFRKAIYWSKKQMEAHAMKYSKGYAAKKGYTFWEKNFDAMAYKTMLRQLISKWGVMSIDLQNAFESDMTFTDESGKTNYVEVDDAIETTATEPQTVEIQPEQTTATNTPAASEKAVNKAQASAEAALFG